MSDWMKLTAAWEAAQARGERALLFTLVDVVGSSYRKVGAHMLATESGAVTGSVSAGCVEADLIARLPELFDSFRPAPPSDYRCAGACADPLVVSYSNTGNDEFALNRGCNGDHCIYIEELFPNSENSLTTFARAQATRAPQVRIFSHPQSKTFVERIAPPLRLYLFGSQRDAAPVATFARAIDMEVHSLRKSDADGLAMVTPDARTAVLIMSHDFDRDREALHAAVGKPFPYVGIMGPRYRTEELLRDAPPIAANLHFPVGLDISAEGAEEIAVSIVGELIQTFRKNAPRVLTVVLAAGEAKRFGSPKQLQRIGDSSFVRRAVMQSLQVPESAATAVVLGAYAERVEEELSGLPVKAIRNDAYATGMGSSIAAAARYAEQNNYTGMMLMTCDQIHVTAQHLSAVVRSNAPLVAASYSSTVGIPCYFSREYFAELQSIAPNEGAKKLLQKHAHTMQTVPIPEAACDIDVREQLAALSATSS
jgi:molybdenum cofactor cytidylyltransferase